MNSFWRLFVSVIVLSLGAVTGCATVISTDTAPLCETNLDESKVWCLYRPGPEGGTIVRGLVGASDPDAVVSATYGYVTYTLWVQEDGAFVIPAICGVPRNAVMTVTVAAEGCAEKTMDISCPPVD